MLARLVPNGLGEQPVQNRKRAFPGRPERRGEILASQR